MLIGVAIFFYNADYSHLFCVHSKLSFFLNWVSQNITWNRSGIDDDEL